ncbi:MAG: Mur ligase family protein [Patescibacteria group bacterium]
MISTYKQAKQYILEFVPKVSKKPVRGSLSFKRISKFIEMLGNPQNNYPTIHIAGTSGKGSTSYLISKILKTAGYKTGLHLSPHLHSIRERAQINNKRISQEKFTEITKKIKPVIEKFNAKKYGKLYFVQIMQGFAMTYFAQEKVDIAVIETGLGGLYDGTNVVNSTIGVITPIDYDHMHILGKTIDKIAVSKAGIIKKSQSAVISAVQKKTAEEVIIKKAKQEGTNLYIENKDFEVTIKKNTKRGVLFDYVDGDKKISNIFCSLVGPHQAHNAALAIKAALELRKIGYKIKNSHIKKALSDSIHYGRFEIMKLGGKSFILDGAHNEHKFSALVETLSTVYPDDKFICIFSCKKNKEIENSIKMLKNKAKTIVATQFSHPTNAGPHSPIEVSIILAKILKAKFSGGIIAIPSLPEALSYVIKESEKKDKILVTGSFHTVGEVRKLLIKKQKLMLKKKATA